MKDQANDKRSPIILIALFITVAFLGLFVWLLSSTETCPRGWWFWHRLSCLEPNALGDTFAGAFAPVAFVWLVAAVLLQRNELSAQRKELRFTREEFVLTRAEITAQREAMEAQAAEARKNVEYIGEQTAILKAGRVRQDEAEKDGRIEGLLQILLERLWDFSGFVMEAKSPQEAGLLNIDPASGSDDLFHRVAQYKHNIDRGLDEFERDFGKMETRKVTADSENFAFIFSAAREIGELREDCSIRMMDRLDHVDWWGFASSLERLEGTLKNSDANWSAEYDRELEQRTY